MTGAGEIVTSNRQHRRRDFARRVKLLLLCGFGASLGVAMAVLTVLTVVAR